MPKFELTYDQQNQLLAALSQIGEHDVATTNGQIVKVPYKLGGERRALVKNIRALQASLATWQDVTKAIFKECFPDVPDGQEVQSKDRPEEFAKYRVAIAASAQAKDEIDLLPFTEKVIYEENEFPAMVVALLEERGLIHEETPASPRLREVK
jgi:hypothetical protein